MISWTRFWSSGPRQHSREVPPLVPEAHAATPGKRPPGPPAFLPIVFAITTFAVLLLTSALWGRYPLLSALCAVVLIATLIGAFRSAPESKARLGWIGVAVGAAVATGRPYLRTWTLPNGISAFSGS